MDSYYFWNIKESEENETLLSAYFAVRSKFYSNII